MSKFLPPKPEFDSVVRIYHGAYDPSLIPSITENAFNKWYDTHIKPLFENAVEVYGSPNWVCWYKAPGPDSNATQKALLINIQEIKPESAEDILRELVDKMKYLKFLKDDIPWTRHLKKPVSSWRENE